MTHTQDTLDLRPNKERPLVAVVENLVCESKRYALIAQMAVGHGKCGIPSIDAMADEKSIDTNNRPTWEQFVALLAETKTLAAIAAQG